MSVLSVQNIQETFVGGNVASSATQFVDPTASGYPVDGEVVVVNSSGVKYDAGTMSYANSPFIQLVQRNGDNLIWSSKIYGDKVVAYRGRAGAQGQEQVYHIGYNGSAGNLDITSGLDFQLTVIENQDDMMWSEQKKKNVVNVPNNLVTTQLDLAKAIVKNQMKKYTTDGSSITAVMLNNGGTVGDAHSASSTVAVTHGSPNIIFTSGGSVVSPSNISAGTVLRIGLTGSTRANTTVPVYTVKEVLGSGTSTVVVLDQPYAGPSDGAVANTAHGVLTATASWGVRFTGKSLPFRRDFFKFKRVAFTLQMSGFGATPLTKTQEALYGYGDGRLVLEEESFSKGFEGALNRMTVPLPLANETFTANGGTVADSPNTTLGDTFMRASAIYDTITIEFFSQDQATVVAVPTMPQLIKFFGFDSAGQNATGTNSVQVVLNAWMATVPGAFANLSVM